MTAVALDHPQGRPLEAGELVRLVEGIAARPERWAAHADPAATERTYAALHRDSAVDIWAIFWLPDNDTGWHDHDTSSGAVCVVEGELDEHALLLGGPERRTRHRGRRARSPSAPRTSTA